MKAWDDIITAPIPGRTKKPRTEGFTMVIDKGMGLGRIIDLLETSADCIDIIKLAFGTSAFYDRNFLQRKNSLITECGIKVMPGGTFLETAVWRNSLDFYLDRARELGFTAIEISDGTISIPDDERRKIIEKVITHGFTAVTEVGKKDPGDKLSITDIGKMIRNDIRYGSSIVIVEAREGGKGVGIFDGQGAVKKNDMEKIAAAAENPSFLMWEAPLKSQQQSLIMRWGPNVNLGNIPPDDILALEALRCGLRGDTLSQAYKKCVPK